MTLKFIPYRSKPLHVEAIYYDGSEEMATELCAEYPKSFCVGRDKNDKFAGLYILVPLAGGKCNMIDVAPEDVIYHEKGEQIFCSVDADAFRKYFVRGRAKARLVIAKEMPTSEEDL